MKPIDPQHEAILHESLDLLHEKHPDLLAALYDPDVYAAKNGRLIMSRLARRLGIPTAEAEHAVQQARCLLTGDPEPRKPDRRTKVTPALRAAILEDIRGTGSLKSIAQKYGVSASTVSMIASSSGLARGNSKHA